MRKDAGKGLSIQIWPCLPSSLGKASCLQQNAAEITLGRGEETAEEGGGLKVKSQLGDDNMVPPCPQGYLENGVASIKGFLEIPSQGQGMCRESSLLSLSCCPSPTFLSSCQGIKDGMTSDFSAGRGYLY